MAYTSPLTPVITHVGTAVAPGAAPIGQFQIGDLFALFSTIITQQGSIAAGAAQVGRDQKDLSKRVDTWDTLAKMVEVVPQQKQEFKQLEAKITDVEVQQIQRYEAEAESAREAAQVQAVVGAVVAIVALPVAPVAVAPVAGAALGGSLRVFAWARGAKGMSAIKVKAESCKQFLIGVGMSLATAGTGATASPLLGQLGNHLAARLAFQAALNVGNTVVEKKLNDEKITAKTLIIAGLAGGGGALAANGAQQLVGPAAPYLVQIPHAGAVAATNAVVNRGIVNVCDRYLLGDKRKPLGEGLKEAAVFAFVVGAAVKAAYICKEIALANEAKALKEKLEAEGKALDQQEAIFNEAMDTARKWLGECVQEGWKLPGTLDEVLARIMNGEPVTLTMGDQVRIIKIDGNKLVMHGVAGVQAVFSGGENIREAPFAGEIRDPTQARADYNVKLAKVLAQQIVVFQAATKQVRAWVKELLDERGYKLPKEIPTLDDAVNAIMEGKKIFFKHNDHTCWVEIDGKEMQLMRDGKVQYKREFEGTIKDPKIVLAEGKALEQQEHVFKAATDWVKKWVQDCLDKGYTLDNGQLNADEIAKMIMEGKAVTLWKNKLPHWFVIEGKEVRMEHGTKHGHVEKERSKTFNVEIKDPKPAREAYNAKLAIEQQENVFKVATDLAKKWVQDCVKEGYQLPRGTSVDEIVKRIMKGQPVQLKQSNSQIRIINIEGNKLVMREENAFVAPPAGPVRDAPPQRQPNEPTPTPPTTPSDTPKVILALAAGGVASVLVAAAIAKGKNKAGTAAPGSTPVANNKPKPQPAQQAAAPVQNNAAAPQPAQQAAAPVQNNAAAAQPAQQAAAPEQNNAAAPQPAQQAAAPVQNNAAAPQQAQQAAAPKQNIAAALQPAQQAAAPKQNHATAAQPAQQAAAPQQINAAAPQQAQLAAAPVQNNAAAPQPAQQAVAPEQYNAGAPQQAQQAAAPVQNNAAAPQQAQQAVAPVQNNAAAPQPVQQEAAAPEQNNAAAPQPAQQAAAPEQNNAAAPQPAQQVAAPEQNNAAAPQQAQQVAAPEQNIAAAPQPVQQAAAPVQNNAAAPAHKAAPVVGLRYPSWSDAVRLGTPSPKPAPVAGLRPKLKQLPVVDLGAPLPKPAPVAGFLAPAPKPAQVVGSGSPAPKPTPGVGLGVGVALGGASGAPKPAALPPSKLEKLFQERESIRKKLNESNMLDQDEKTKLQHRNRKLRKAIDRENQPSRVLPDLYLVRESILKDLNDSKLDKIAKSKLINNLQEVEKDIRREELKRVQPAPAAKPAAPAAHAEPAQPLNPGKAEKVKKDKI